MKRTLLTNLITAVLIMIVCGTAAAKSRAPNGLMIEFLQGPIVNGITDATPEFSWIVHSSRKNDRQSAYHILVSSDRQMLAENKADMWDSKKRNSTKSINVPYSGRALQPNKSYYWKLKTWCSLGGESEWSETMKFSTSSIGGEYVTTRYRLRQTAVSPSEIIKKSDGHYVIDFGKVAFGYLHLELNSPKDGHQMEVHFGERGDANGVNKNPGGTVRYHKITQSLTSGVNKLDIHPPADQRNTGPKAIKLPAEFGVVTPFRYVELVNCPVELRKPMIQQISIHYPFNENASTFESSDLVLNDIWSLCKYSMKVTSFCGVYVDGDRERIPYEADAYINQLSHYAVDREYTLARYSHEYLLKHPTWPTEWKHHSVLIAWADFMYTGNTESLVQNYEVLKSKTLENCVREDGLLNTKGMRDIVDWPKGERDGYEFKEVNTVVNAFYYKTLIQMADIAAVLGKDSDAAAYQKKAANVKSVFNKVFLDSQRGVYLDGENAKHASLHANMMPLAFDLVPEEHKKSVTDFVVSKGMACSVYGAQYLLEALYEGGQPEVAFERMTSKDIRSWYNMLRVGSTITLEAWDNKFKPNQDWNHAWGAVPGNIIPRYLLGVRPLEAGFGKVLIHPLPGPLANVNATIPTIRGPIGVKIVNYPGKPFILELSTPVNMTARVEIPLPDGQGEITVDGKAVPSKKVRGFALVENVGSGIHMFRTDEVVKAQIKREIYY